MKSAEAKSLRQKLWFYFMLFAALILVLLWLLQTVFITSFYESAKMSVVERVSQKVLSSYGQSNFQETIEQLSFQNNVLIIVADMNGQSVYASDQMGGQMMGGSSRINARAFLLMRQRLLSNPKGEIHEVINNPISGQLMVHAFLVNKDLGNPTILYISTPLSPIHSTISILRYQFIYITGIVLLLTIILSIFLSKKLSRPIVKVTSAAQKLAQGDYDITFEKGDYQEINQLSDTLNFATAELSKTENLRKELIANVSHDLRTPLTMIRAYAEMVRDLSGENPEKRNQHLGVIIDESQKLSSLVDDLLDLSKIQSGNLVLSSSQEDLCTLAEETISRFGLLTERDGYLFELNCKGNATVSCDRMRMLQVLYNLVSNAVNFTGNDKRVVINVEEQNHQVRLEVKDTGQGIPPEQLDKIWERYYKSGEAHRRSLMGSGLGLSIVRSILVAHDADYGVISTSTQGSTFWFALPKGQAEGLN